MTTTAASSTQTQAPPQGATPEQLIRWVFERLNARDTASLRPLWQDTVEYFPHGVCRGADEIARYFEQTFEAMPNDFNLEIVNLAADGENVFVRWRITGTFNGRDYQGLVANGKRIDLAGVDDFVLRDGSIVSNHVTFDQLTFARQLGLLPGEGSIGETAMRSLFNLKTRAVAAVKR